MLVTCWAVKGGVGTTVVAALLGAHQGRSSPDGALAVDLCGDLPAVLGVTSDPPSGLVQWLDAPDTALDSLGRASVPAGDRLRVLGRGPVRAGRGAVDPARIDLFVSLLADAPRPTVVDAGLVPGCGPLADLAARLIARSARSLLVTRACYLALRRARDLPVRPDGVVVVREPHRALGRRDIQQVVGAPVVLEVAVDPAIARAVDAGLLAARLPRGLSRAIDRVSS